MKDSVNVSWKYQLWRIRFRAYVMWQAILAALFWFGIAYISGSLNARGLGPLAWLLVLVWLFFAIPGLLFQIETITDIVSYLLTGRTTFYPAMRKRLESGEIDRQFAQLPPRVQRVTVSLFPVVSFAADVSPISAIATWASIVLARLPEKAHAPVTRTPTDEYVTFTLARAKHKRFETAVLEDIVDRLLGNRMPDAA